jgi:hypothetical protein
MPADAGAGERRRRHTGVRERRLQRTGIRERRLQRTGIRREGETPMCADVGAKGIVGLIPDRVDQLRIRLLSWSDVDVKDRERLSVQACENELIARRRLVPTRQATDPRAFFHVPEAHGRRPGVTEGRQREETVGLLGAGGHVTLRG